MAGAQQNSTSIVTSFRQAMALAPGRLISLAIVMVPGWYVGRHAIYWCFTAFAEIESGAPRHWLAAHPEAQIASGEVWFGWLAAWACGALLMENTWSSHRYEQIGRRENVSPTLLYLVDRPERYWPATLMLLPPLDGAVHPVFVLARRPCRAEPRRDAGLARRARGSSIKVKPKNQLNRRCNRRPVELITDQYAHSVWKWRTIAQAPTSSITHGLESARPKRPRQLRTGLRTTSRHNLRRRAAAHGREHRRSTTKQALSSPGRAPSRTFLVRVGRIGNLKSTFLGVRLRP